MAVSYTFLLFGLVVLLLNATNSTPVYPSERYDEKYPTGKMIFFRLPSNIYNTWKQQVLTDDERGRRGWGNGRRQI